MISPQNELLNHPHERLAGDKSDTLELTSITAWREYRSDWTQDVDNSPVASQQLRQILVNEQWSQELRLTGTLFDDRLDFTVGGFYFERDGTLTARVDLNYAGIDFQHGPDPTPAKNYAVFGNATFHVSDDFNITAGLRQSWDRKSYTFFRRNPDLTVPGPLPCAFFLGAPVAGPPAVGNEPNCLLLGLNKADLMRACIDRLSPDHREIIDLVYYQELSVKEAGEVLGIPENTVKTRMFYARKQLSALFSRYGVDRGWP